MTAEPLPDVYQGHLDEAALGAYAADLAALAGPIQVSVKSAERAYVDEALQPSVEEALAALAAGRVRAVQLRYRHETVSWTDTLFRAAGGYRLVRMQAPS